MRTKPVALWYLDEEECEIPNSPEIINIFLNCYVNHFYIQSLRHDILFKPMCHAVSQQTLGHL